MYVCMYVCMYVFRHLFMYVDEMCICVKQVLWLVVRSVCPAPGPSPRSGSYIAVDELACKEAREAQVGKHSAVTRLSPIVPYGCYFK